MKRLALWALIALPFAGLAVLAVHPPALITELFLRALFAFAKTHPPAVTAGEMTEQDWIHLFGIQEYRAVSGLTF